MPKRSICVKFLDTTQQTIRGCRLLCVPLSYIQKPFKGTRGGHTNYESDTKTVMTIITGFTGSIGSK